DALSRPVGGFRIGLVDDETPCLFSLVEDRLEQKIIRLLISGVGQKLIYRLQVKIERITRAHQRKFEPPPEFGKRHARMQGNDGNVSHPGHKTLRPRAQLVESITRDIKAGLWMVTGEVLKILLSEACNGAVTNCYDIRSAAIAGQQRKLTDRIAAGQMSHRVSMARFVLKPHFQPPSENEMHAIADIAFAVQEIAAGDFLALQMGGDFV